MQFAYIAPPQISQPFSDAPRKHCWLPRPQAAMGFRKTLLLLDLAQRGGSARVWSSTTSFTRHPV